MSQYAVPGNLAKRGREGAFRVGDLADRPGLDRAAPAHGPRPPKRAGPVAALPGAADAHARHTLLAATRAAERT